MNDTSIFEKITTWIFFGPAKNDYIETDKVLRVVTLNIVAIIGSIYIIIFFTQLLAAGQINVPEAAVAYFSSLIFIVSFIIIHTEKGMKRFDFVKTTVVFTLLILYSMIYAVIPYGDKWAFLIPLMIIFLMELKWGLILSTLYFLGMVAVEITLQLRSTELFIRYAAVFWAQVTLIVGYEVLRIINNRKLLEDRAEIELLSITDHLTKLYNRRYFSSSIEKEYARSIRQKESLSFLMIDADHFKKYNDTYGHLHGDKTLVFVADVLKKVAARSSDLVFRMGGEEFGILLPDTDSTGAAALAEKVRAEVNSLGIITVSVGYACVMPQLGESPEKLFKIADNNLYKAKELGRNRVVG